MQGRYRRANRTLVAAAVVAMVACVPVLGGCKPPPPALTKAELDAAKMPEKHPKLAKLPENGCRSCHREQPAIKPQ